MTTGVGPIRAMLWPATMARVGSPRFHIARANFIAGRVVSRQDAGRIGETRSEPPAPLDRSVARRGDRRLLRADRGRPLRRAPRAERTDLLRRRARSRPPSV